MKNKIKLIAVISAMVMSFVFAGCQVESDSHEHSFSKEWTSDETSHWHAATCEHTEEVSEKAAHTFGDYVSNNDATTESDGTKTRKCSVCGYQDTVTDAGSKIETVATPTFSVESGEVISGTSVTITCATEGAKIYYTKDGSEPTASGTEYTEAISITEVVTLKAIAVKSGMSNSTVASVSYRIIPEGFVKVTGITINGDETWTPSSSVFVSGRTLTIPDMYVSDHEVTQAEYAKYCKYGSSSPSSSYGVGDNYPAYYVNWYDAVVYCNLRSIDEELTPAYKIGEETDPRKWSGIVSDSKNKYCGPSNINSTWDALTYDKEANGYRLPTEAEWEYIAREEGKSTTTYSGSGTIGDVAWYWDNSSSKTHEVKGKNANSLGIYDMSGNVWEWCYDWYSSINSSTADTGASSGDDPVIRGGSWGFSASLCTVSNRNIYGPYGRDNDLGFRVVRSAN